MGNKKDRVINVAIVQCPESAKQQSAVCAICGKEQNINTMSAGLRDKNNQQAFACDRHRIDNGKLIKGWAQFAAKQNNPSLKTRRGANHA